MYRIDCSLLLLTRVLTAIMFPVLAAPAKEPGADMPLPAEEAARTMVVPDGFHVTLFAAEPDIRQPIGFCLDDRGRLWVAEAHAYPKHSSKPGGDRVVILEDRDGDGHHDHRTVFYDKLNYVSGIEVGFGGAWVMSPPYFFFIPDRDGDDRPDGAPRIVLDGFGNHANAHNMANGFAWGPDGWLYGTHGRTNWSLIGRPGSPKSQRIRFDGGVWRYHPVRDVWEPYADGTTNPWGIDWNDQGEAFMSTSVDPHLYHVIQGAHYEPWRNRKSSRHAYARIPTIADHRHFTGQGNVREKLGTEMEDEAGGGHSHCGMMIYLGDSWPRRYRNTIFMHNIHGRRINNDIPLRQGSGYSAAHAHDVLVSKDPWFMGVTLRYGPDGSVFSSDWSDTGECHSTRNTRRHTGRIYKISYGDSPSQPPNLDLARMGSERLVELQQHRNDWFVRHARRLLHERHAAGDDMADARRHLHAMFREQEGTSRRLRALWALHAIGGLDDAFLVKLLGSEDEYIRSWAVKLLCEDNDPPSDALSRLHELATAGTSAFVRLQIASALQRLRVEARWPIVEALTQRSEDAGDVNLPLMIWYGVEPMVDVDIARFVALAGTARIPLLRRHIARRVASLETPASGEGLALLCLLLERCSDDARSDLLSGIEIGFAGRRHVAMPEKWASVSVKLRRSGRASIRRQAERIALVFDDPAALRSLRARIVDERAPAAERQSALRALLARRVDDFAPTLLKLTLDPVLSGASLRGLADYDHPDTAKTILRAYPSFDAPSKQDALQTLASRIAWADELLDAIAARKVPRADVSAYTARQIRNLGETRLVERLRAVWGEVRTTPQDKIREIARYKRRLKPETLAKADRSNGRAIFEKTCASCHRLFDTGGSIGPDITGAQRKNLDYVLENLLDPSASVSRDYQMTVVTTNRGRVVTGIVIDEGKTSVTLQTVNEKIILPTAEIQSRTLSSSSLMPDGLLATLPISQVRDLIAYLQSSRQVPKR